MAMKSRALVVGKTTKADVDIRKRNKLEQENIQSEEAKKTKTQELRQYDVAAINNNKRKRKEQEKNPPKAAAKKNKRKRNEESCNEDRFSSLPESLRLHILSSLDAKNAVQTSVLSKSFKSSWASIPALNFCSYIGFKRRQLRDFDKFVEMVLANRDDSVSSERLSFIRSGSCSAKMFQSVFGYALSHGVKELEAHIDASRTRAWPDFLNYSSTDSLTSLTLKSESCDLDCLFLGPRASGLFKNLSVLYLKRGIIRYVEPFSGFPVLEKLTLIDCRVETDGLNISALNLSELKILCTSRYEILGCLNLTTPKLKLFEFKSFRFPLLFKTHTDLRILDTVVLEFPGSIIYHVDDKRKIEDDRLCMLRAVQSANSFAVFSSVVMQLSLFENTWLDDQPFQKFKLDLTDHLDDDNFLDNSCRWLIESLHKPSNDHSCSVTMRI